MAAHARIEPIGDVDGAIRTDAHVGRTELGLQIAGGLATEEVGARPFLLFIGGEEIEALELHAGAVGLGQVTEDDVLAGFTGEEETVPLRIEGAVLIEGHAGGRAAAIDVACRHGAGVVLTPFGDRGLLARTLVGTPGALTVGGRKTGVAAFHDQGDAAGGRIVVVALIHVAERVDGLLVAVTVVVTDDAGVRAVAVHAHGETADPDVAVVAAEAGDLLGVDRLLGPFAMIIGAADAEGLARLVGELSAGVALVEVPLPVRTERRAVERVVMVAAVEAGQKHLAFVDLGIEDAVAVHVGVDQEVRRLRDDDLAVDVRDAEGGDEVFFLREDRDLVGLARAGRIFEDHDAVAFRTTSLLAPVVDAFGDVHPSALVEIDVRRVEDLRRGRPDGHLKAFRHGEEFSRDGERTAIEVDRLVLSRSGREHRELHVGRAGLTAADGTAIVDADLGAERSGRTGQFVGNERGGMRADAAGVFLAGDLERLTVVILAHAGLAQRLGILPLQLGQVDHAAVHQDNLGFDPVGPVTGVLAEIGDYQIELLGSVEFGAEIDQALLVLGEQDGRLGDRLRVSGEDRNGQGEEGQQRETSLTGYVGHR